MIDQQYMYRCFQLAVNGKGLVNPNPMVGAVIVHDHKIIGEGYHRRYGQAHAEVNAIASVKDKSLLSESTLYVSLEPCSHHGKTPPCSQLIIESGIPRVVVACLDPYHKVSGRGVQELRKAGVEVEVGVLENEAKELNKEFITAQTKNRPYIYLKWAQSADGYIDRERANAQDYQAAAISSDFTRMLVHKQRAEVSAIMIGTNTAIKDNPSLTTRFWSGKNPIRVVLDRQGRIPSDYRLCDGEVETIIFTENIPIDKEKKGLKYEKIVFDDHLLDNVFRILHHQRINSVMIEGGQILLQSVIDKQLWDEAQIEISDLHFGKGVKAPVVGGRLVKECVWGTSRNVHLCLE